MRPLPADGHGTLGQLRQPRAATVVPVKWSLWRCSDGLARGERYPVAGVALEPAVQLELHQCPLYLGRARLALPDQLVDKERLRPETLAQAGEKVGAVHRLKRQLRRARRGARSGPPPLAD